MCLGIGRAIANRLARDGLNVVVNDVPAKRDKLEAVANEVRATGRQSIAVTADVSSDTEVKGMVDRAVGELGGLHVVRLRYRFLIYLRSITSSLDGGQRRRVQLGFVRR